MARTLANTSRSTLPPLSMAATVRPFNSSAFFLTAATAAAPVPPGSLHRIQSNSLPKKPSPRSFHGRCREEQQSTPVCWDERGSGCVGASRTKGGQEPNWLTRQFVGSMLTASRSRILAHRQLASLERLTDATSSAVRCCRAVLSCTEPR